MVGFTGQGVGVMGQGVEVPGHGGGVTQRGSIAQSVRKSGSKG
jgi:hypothetical protein